MPQRRVLPEIAQRQQQRQKAYPEKKERGEVVQYSGSRENRWPERRFVGEPYDQGGRDGERHLKAPRALSGGPQAVDDDPDGGPREHETRPRKQREVRAAR